MDYFHQYKGKSGIYRIRNIINDKFYIGSAKDFYCRWMTHMYDFKRNKNSKYLQYSFNKYGSENFAFEVVEYVDDISALIEREQYWIDKTNCTDKRLGYNLSPTAGSNLGFKFGPPSEETRIKISEGQIGKIVSEETKKRMSSQRKGKGLGKRPKEIGEKISKSKMGAKRDDQIGSKNNKAIFTEKDVENIKLQIASGVRLKEISINYKCDLSIIYDIKNKVSWKHVLPELDLSNIRHVSSKVTEEQVKQIKNILKEDSSKENVKLLSELFKVSESIIRDIRNGTTWRKLVV